MSLSQLSKQTIIRLPKIKVGLLQKKTRDQIGASCNVTEKTIDRDIQAWTKTDDFLIWIREVWLDKYQKIDDLEVFRQATKIMVKTITAKSEEQVDIRERVKVDVDIHAVIERYRSAIASIAKSDLPT